jgi:hypothetical protein
MSSRRSWPRSDKLRLAGCLAVSALIYGGVSGALFFGSKSFLRETAGVLVMTTLAMLPVTGFLTGYVTRPSKPWSEAWLLATFVTVVVLAIFLGMEASQNTCGTPESGSCDSAAGASFVFLVLPAFVAVWLGALAGKSAGRWAAHRKAAS